MALADTARLVASLELKDEFSKTAAKADRTLDSLERKTNTTLGRVRSEAGRGLATAGRNIAFLGAAGGALLLTQIKAGVDSLVELEEAAAQTNARIEATGGVAGVTAEDVRSLAVELENLTTIDDKAIQRGQNMLLTFTNIRDEVGEGNDIFSQATETVLDLATAMGTEPEQAALQLGKALNDPVRGLTALRRVGVQFTEQQESQIKKMVEAGDVMGAQKVILKELNTEFGGSARAFAEGPGAAQRRFADAVEDGQQALATGLLPVIERFSRMAQDTFSDPKVIEGIQSFGEGLGEGIEQLIDIATKLPWEAIGGSLQIAGAGAKTLLDAFTSLPDWVQTAVITGWGLNKLTGGALGNIAGTLAKSAFGALRGATPANPVFTKEVGLGGAGGAPVAAGGSKLATAAKFILGPAAAVLIGNQIGQAVTEGMVAPARDFATGQIDAVLASGDASRIERAISVIEDQLNPEDFAAQTALALDINGVRSTLEGQRDALIAQLQEMGLSREEAQRIGEVQANIAEGARNDANRYASQLNAQVLGARSDAARAAAEHVAAIRGTAANTATQLARIESVESGTREYTRQVAGKNFSPNVNVGVDVFSTISVSDVVRASIHTRTASGFRGGNSEL